MHGASSLLRCTPSKVRAYGRIGAVDLGTQDLGIGVCDLKFRVQGFGGLGILGRRDMGPVG